MGHRRLPDLGGRQPWTMRGRHCQRGLHIHGRIFGRAAERRCNPRGITSTLTKETFMSAQRYSTLQPAVASAISRNALWAGRIVSGLVVLFTLMDGTMK